MIPVWRLARGELFRLGTLILEFERMDGFRIRLHTCFFVQWFALSC